MTVGSQAPKLVQRSRRTWARFPRRVYGVGTEPDPRFSLANERTFLAWIRTSLALVAGGIALEAVAVPISPPLRFGVARLLVSLGLAASVQAWFGWVRDERAIREGRPLGGDGSSGRSRPGVPRLPRCWSSGWSSGDWSGRKR